MKDEDTVHLLIQKSSSVSHKETKTKVLPFASHPHNLKAALSALSWGRYSFPRPADMEHQLLGISSLFLQDVKLVTQRLPAIVFQNTVFWGRHTYTIVQSTQRNHGVIITNLKAKELRWHFRKILQHLSWRHYFFFPFYLLIQLLKAHIILPKNISF